METKRLSPDPAEVSRALHGKMETKRLTMDVDELAKATNVSKSTLYGLVRKGKLPSIRISTRRIVFPVAALERFLSETGKPKES